MAGFSSGIDGVRANPKLFEVAQARVRQSGELVNAAQQAASDLFAMRSAAHADKKTGTPVRNDLERPQLAEPQRGAGLTSGATLTLLLGELLVLIGTSMVNQLQSRLDTFKSMMAAREQSLTELSVSTEKLLAEEKTAVDALEHATTELKQAKSEEAKAQAILDKAQAKLDAAKQDTPEYKKALAERAAAAVSLSAAQTRTQAAETAGSRAADIAARKSTAATAALNAGNKAGINGPAAEKMGETNLTNLARLTFLMATFIELVGKNSESSLKSSLSLFEAMQEARQESMNKSAKEFDEQVRKAEEAQRISGCIGKIIGALITLVAIVATVASFGTATAAGVALGAVGIAFMVADTAVGAATGKSLTDRALAPVMEPLMKSVILPMMEFLTKVASAVLTELGFSKEVVEKAAAIMAAVIVAVVMVVVMVVVAMVGKSAASKLADVIGKVVGEAVKKMAPQFIKQAAGKAGQAITRAAANVTKSFGLKTDAASVQVYAKNLGRVQNGLMLAQSGTQAGGSIAHGTFQINIAKAAANMVFSENMMRQLSEFIKAAIDQFSSTQQMVQSMTSAMSNIAADQAQTGQVVLTGVRHSGRA